MSHVCGYLAICFAVLSSQTTTNAIPVTPAEDKAVRVGVFDSRAIAVAYYRSSDFNNSMKELHAEHKKAREAGEDKRVKELEAKGKALNDQAHQQGFGTSSVDAILKQIKNQLPAIAKANNVQVMVSQWNLTYQEKDAKLIDVTDQLVTLFHPDEATLKVIRDLRKKAPVENAHDH